MTSPPEQSSLVVLVPESERLVGDLRSRCDPSAQRGAPAHVTLLFPFAHPDALSGALLEEIGRLVAGVLEFATRFSGVCGFPGVVYLAPDDLTPFDGLTRRLCARFPEWRPYEGAFTRPTPHLTVAQARSGADLEAVSAELAARIAASGPIEATVRSVCLLEKRAQHWSVHRHFDLRRSAS